MLSNYNHEKLSPALTTILQQQAEYSLNSKRPWLSCPYILNICYIIIINHHLKPLYIINVPSDKIG